MRTLIVGDVHGCAVELRRLVELARPDRVVLVGDLYAKGPDPAGVWRMVREGGWQAVLGNHDAKLVAIARGQRAPTQDSLLSIHQLVNEDPGWLDWLHSRPLFLDVEGFTVVHAGLHPSGLLIKTTRKMALTMRSWPLGEEGGPF
ncbi:MAG: metallophosphatase, partial [Proteobacteria bacterium]|nr:metallophosphatase [Pseudomonadota bacterium]